MISAFISLLLRVFFVLVTVLTVFVLLAVGVCTLVLMLVWSVLRGRKPVLDVSGFARARQAATGRASSWPGARGAASRAAADVVDVEAREVSPGPMGQPARLE